MSTRGSAGPIGAALAAAPVETLDVQEYHRARFKTQPAAGCEIGQSLIDGLARRADQLRKLLLGQVVRDEDALVSGATETLGEVEQRLGDAAGDVGEDQVGQRVVGATQTPCQRGKQASRHGRALLEEVAKRVVAKADELRLGNSGRRSVAGAGVEETELAEHLARTENRHEVLSAVGAGAPEFYLARLDDVQPITLLALPKKDFASIEMGAAHSGLKRGHLFFFEGSEQGCISYGVVLHMVSVPEITGIAGQVRRSV